MSTIGTLAVKLTANAGSFVKGLDSASKSIADFSAKSAKLSVGIGATLLGAGAAMATFGAKSATELSKTQRELGANAAGLSELQYAATSLGGTNADVNAGLKALNETLAEAAHGGFAAGDAFARLGLDAGKLSKVRVDAAFLAVAKSLAAVSDPASRAAQATQIFGSSAGKLLPLLSQGEAGLAKFASEAKALGVTLSDSEASAIEDAFAFTALSSAFEGVSRQIASQLAPWINAASDAFKKFATEGGNVGDIVAASFRFIAKGVAYAVDGVKIFRVGLMGLEIAFDSLLLAGSKSIAGLLTAISKLPDSLGGGKWAKDAAATIDTFAEGAKQAMKDTAREMRDLWKTQSATSQVDAFFDGLKRKQTELSKTRVNVKTGGGSTDEFARNAAQFAKAKSLIDSVKSPFEAFGETLRGLNSMIAVGAVGWDTYAKAAGKAVAELEKAHGMQDIRLAGAARQGSVEAYSAIVRSDKEGDVRTRESVQDRVARILTEAKAIEKEQLANLRKIADALTDRAVVKEVMIQ